MQGAGEGYPRKLVIGDINNMWIEYDKQSDTLYIGFSDKEAEESFMLDDGTIVNVSGDELISIVIQNASSRLNL
ncbi:MULTISPECIES: DUF2283 domain-containing protein [Acidilobus]|uniref:DUF2283 domain-containing protein n=1 Tax=Acidilobus saccharovorans (strain DSM 16705 / JCM 18335 / VKM B-2471 / 345-15) TaxID=666510 RepID=D9PZQ4_ACIS3|nr:DUF2283 domain-containing protein [Acidilobus saccharovorans]ADL18542.1 hypothetical protein ASAC_0134 [Acidilobus saccharovorans 345-15]